MIKSFEHGEIKLFVTTPTLSTLMLSAIALGLSASTGILQRSFLLKQLNASDAPAVWLSVHESLGAAEVNLLVNTLTLNSCSDVFSSSESSCTCCCCWPLCEDDISSSSEPSLESIASDIPQSATSKAE